MLEIDPEDIIGRIYITEPEEDRTRTTLKIERIEKQENEAANDRSMIKSRAKNNDETIKEVITCNQLINKITEEDGHVPYAKVGYLDKRVKRLCQRLQKVFEFEN